MAISERATSSGNKHRRIGGAPSPVLQHMMDMHVLGSLEALAARRHIRHGSLLAMCGMI
jgi:hypothetical protein